MTPPSSIRNVPSRVTAGDQRLLRADRGSRTRAASRRSPRSIGAHSSASSAAPPPASTRLVGSGPSRAPPGASAWPVDARRRPARALRSVVHHARARRRPGSAAAAPWACPRRRRRAAACAGSAASRQVDRRRRDPLAEPAAERAAALGVREPVEGARGRAARAARRPRAAPAPPGTRPAAAPTGSPAAARLGARRARRAPRGSMPRRPTAVLDGVAAAPARRDADHLHERVGGAVERRAAGAGRDARARPPPTVQMPCASSARRSAHGERGRQRRAAQPPGRAARSRGRSPWWARAGCARGKPGKAPAPARRPRPRRRLRRGARSRAAPRRRRSSSTRGPRGRRAATASSTRQVVDRGGLRRPVAREAQHQRALAGHVRERLGRPGPRPSARSASSSVALALTRPPPRTSRKRAGARAVRDVHRSGPARPCRSRAAP